MQFTEMVGNGAAVSCFRAGGTAVRPTGVAVTRRTDHHEGFPSGLVDGARLTSRERDVLRLLAERYANPDIAARLGISTRTVESHVAALMRKLARSDRRDLIAAAGPSRFRDSLTQMLREVEDPVEVHARAAELLGRHLGATRAYFQEFDRARGTFTIGPNYTEHAPSIAGTYPLAEYTASPVEAALHAGLPLVVRDCAELGPPAAAAWETLGVRAALAVPAMRNGTCVAALAITCAHPRDWTDEDVALLEETAERTWAAAERTRLQKELGESTEQLRAIADSKGALIWQTDPQGATSYTNPAFRAYTGLLGGSASGVFWGRVLRADDEDGEPSGYPGAVHDGTVWRGRLRIRRCDGSWQVHDSNLLPRFDTDGSYLGMLAVCLEAEKQTAVLRPASHG